MSYSQHLLDELRRLDIVEDPVQTLLAQVPQGLILAEAPSGRILFMSAEVGSILGELPLEVEGIDAYDAWQGVRSTDGRAYGAHEWPLARALRGETVMAEEILMARPDGGRTWIRASAAPVTDRAGQIRAALVVFFDITDQKMAERRAGALAHLATRLGAARTAADVYRVIIDQGRQTLDAYAGGIVVPEGSGEQLHFIEAVGYPQPLIDRYRTFPADAPIPAAHVLKTGDALFLTQDAWVARFRGPATASPTRSIAVLPLRVDERTVAALTLSFDTPRTFLPAERDFMQALAEHCGQALERALLYDAERDARAAAEAASREKDQFLAMVSHELRTPVNAMAGWLGILRQRAAAHPDLTRAIEALERGVSVQARLVGDLLDLSRVESGKLRLHPEPVEALRLAQSAVEGARIAALEKGVDLQFRTEPHGSGRVLADAARLQQILGNLLSNAIKFTPRGGAVTLSLCRLRRNVALTVTDTGDGIDPELLPFVFDRFTQGAGRPAHEGGLGLGLAIVRHLVEAHNGLVYAASRGSGAGALFCVLLPLVADGQPGEAPEIATSTVLAAADVLALAEGAARQARIRAALEAHGATVRLVGTAPAALEAIAGRCPHAIVCDGAGGPAAAATFLRLLRDTTAGGAAHLPVVVIASPETAASRTIRGCNTVVPEPLDDEQLVAALAGIMTGAGVVRG